MRNKLIHRLPRILSLLFIGFLSLFSFDVFGNYHGVELIIALFVHLLPSIGLLIFVLIAWKYGLVGAAAFTGFAIFYTFAARENLAWVVIIAGPSLTIGLLYFWDWKIRKAI